VNRADNDRDYTDFGLTDPAQLEAMVAASRRVPKQRRRRGVAPVPPRPRAPLVEDEPSGVPAAQPSLWSRRISQQMGWVPDRRKQRRCTTCLAGPGQSCINHDGRPMRGIHPEGRGEDTPRS
jgi:hypothetical protein